MKNDLSCAVVRDLLPSYIEGLCSDDSNQAVQEHMSRCPSCRELYASMSIEAEAEENQQPEIDYLKNIKKKNRKRLRNAVIITASALLTVFVLALLAQLFVIGTPLSSPVHRPELSQSEGLLHLSFNNPNSGKSYGHWETEYTGFGSPSGEGQGEINIKAREVLSSPLYPSGQKGMSISLDGLSQVSFMGRPLWVEGLIISPEAEALLALSVDYVGAAYKVSALLGALKLPQLPYKMSIQSEKEPYGLLLEFDAPLSAEDEALMEKNALLALALIDNLGEFSWSSGSGTGSLSCAQAFALLPDMFLRYNESHGTDWSVLSELKLYSGSEYHVQQLLNVLKY